MAHFRAYVSFDIQKTDILYRNDLSIDATTSSIIFWSTESEFTTYCYGSFSYTDGNITGYIDRIYRSYYGVETGSAKILDVTGLHLDVAYAFGDSQTLFRKAFSGDDKMIGSHEADSLNGFKGDDTMWGGGGADWLTGSYGRDSLHGQSGRDRLSGGSGRDILDGGTGNDRLTGGKDADVFVFAKASGHDVIVDFESHDHIQIDSGASRFSQLDITKDGHDALIAFAETEIRLLDTRLHSIDAHDFLF